MVDITPQNKKRILLIEDDQGLRELYADYLEQEGYEVDKKGDGEEGFFAMQKGGYDLILLDVVLPKLDGLAILEKLKTQPPQKPNGPILLLSNLGQDTTLQKAIALGAKEYITKSNVTPDQILQKIKQYINS